MRQNWRQIGQIFNLHKPAPEFMGRKLENLFLCCCCCCCCLGITNLERMFNLGISWDQSIHKPLSEPRTWWVDSLEIIIPAEV